ncbi:MAG: dihydrofolate reductase [Bacteriovoracaceae bacterium]|jgi:dihydrofolate reductase|nr:dihydrofolate reductase [Bacteriovoracaceae bacterium]
MIVSAIVACGKNSEIGFEGKMLWHLSEEFKNFKKTTMGHHLIMGRKTFESIGRPLPGRTTIVLTKDPTFHADGVQVCSSVIAALTMAKASGEVEVFICGGGSIYDQSLEILDRLYLTEVDYSGDADTFFPLIEMKDWDQLSCEEHPVSESNKLHWDFKILEKK